eukprot:TRINITY_DN1862_c0_g7_i1.p1 TRINITY_DN1862_c0_g7~~TRINITY_DN1862_c0_g7_i1.p1  ORF type:complete len:360 (+),score=109.55 TRINITY_DN1862_c0_g7_i1:53-1132(+)
MGKTIRTPLQDLLKVQHPLLLAGMGNVATAKLAAEVSNAGGLGVIGGVTLTPKKLREEITKLKELLHDKTAFGVDLLLPKIGGGARKTNHDYTGGKLAEVIDIIIESKARLFISAVGVPEKWVVDKLHAAGVLVANMVGHPKHAVKAAAVGVDLVIAQGYEAGGHTGEIATMVLIPQVIDAVKGKTSPLTGGPVHVLAAGGIYDGRTCAAAFCLGAAGVWVGTRFIASEEATTSKLQKQMLLETGPSELVRTLVYTGRPARLYETEFVNRWETQHKNRIEELTSQGVVPFKHMMKQQRDAPEQYEKDWGDIPFVKMLPNFMGQAAGGIHEILPAKAIVKAMMNDAADIISSSAIRVAKL